MVYIITLLCVLVIANVIYVLIKKLGHKANKEV